MSHKDTQLINDLGGSAQLSRLLNYPKNNGTQRVNNWKKRGIPASVKLKYPDIFLRQRDKEPIS